MAPLDKAATWLLQQPDIERQLKLADTYMQHAVKMGSLTLPKAEAPLAPIISEFSTNARGYMKWVKNLRDDLPRGSVKEQLHAFYRTLDIRLQQQTRRERFNRAVDRAIEKFGAFKSAKARVEYGVELEQTWTKRRIDFLNMARKNHPAGRLSSDERAEVAEQFWGLIDEEITAGKLPRP